MLIRLGGCPGWSESSLGTHAILLVLSWWFIYMCTSWILSVYVFRSRIGLLDIDCKVFQLYHKDPKFSSRQFWVNNVDSDQSLIILDTVCHSIYIFWALYLSVKPHSSHSTIITATFLAVQIFRYYRYVSELRVWWWWETLLLLLNTCVSRNPVLTEILIIIHYRK